MKCGLNVPHAVITTMLATITIIVLIVKLKTNDIKNYYLSANIARNYIPLRTNV